MKLQSMRGIKIFRELEDDTIELFRILDVKKYKDGGNPSTIKVRDEGSGEIKRIRVDTLSEYSPLEPDGLLTFNIVNMKTKDFDIVKDVIVTASKMLNIKIGDTIPFAVCRQNITDIFYNLLAKDESDMICGLSVNRNNCPTNFDYTYMMACNSISYTESINIYRTDTLQDIYYIINKKKFDDVLNDLFTEHANASNNPSVIFKKTDKGWCKDLETLLKENNFQADINEMLGITAVDFAIKDYLIKAKLPNGTEYDTVTPDLKTWLSAIYKVNISDITVLVYDHDINLGDFNTARYFLLRDKTDILYLIVYTIDGEYFEKDLEEDKNKEDFSTKFRLNFYNKYNVNK